MIEVISDDAVAIDDTVFGTGWRLSPPDMRDYTEEDAHIAAMTKGLLPSGTESAPGKVDLREWCSAIDDQGRLGSCTAHAAVGVVEYYQRRAFGKHIDGSRLFVYKATHNLMGVTGNRGATLRTTMAALRLCGVPPEKYWPYTTNESTFDIDPPAFVYAVADNYEAVKYFAHDPMSKMISSTKVLGSVKKYLSLGIPAIFGFYGFSSFGSGDKPGHIPSPGPGEWVKLAHAVAAVGYDDEKVIVNTQRDISTTGALLIRNSWGAGWGEGGYGWLPYKYVLTGYARDFWSLLQMEWVDTGEFGLK